MYRLHQRNHLFSFGKLPEQCDVARATKPAEVYLVHTWWCESEWCISGGGVPNIVLGPSFCMAKLSVGWC